MKNSKIRVPARWEKRSSNVIPEQLNDVATIPVPPSNDSYTLTQSIMLAIKKARDLKRTVDLETSFFERLSTNAMQLDAVSGALGDVMLRLAKLGYGVSRELPDFTGKTLDFFVDIYRADKRDIFEFSRKEVDAILQDSSLLVGMIDRIKLSYSRLARVQSPIDELEGIKTQLKRCENLLNFVR